MRTSILSRTVIAAAALGIGSVALAAAPATAATSNGITRDMVLTAAAKVRADRADEVGTSDATRAALLELSSRACDLSGSTGVDSYGRPVETPGSVDGLVVTAFIVKDGHQGTCTFSAIAPTDQTLRLSGSMTVKTYTSDSSQSGTNDAVFDLSGDVFASKAVQLENGYADSGFTSAGSAVGSTKVVRTYPVPNATTRSDRLAARKMYDTRVTNARRAYAKALKKADTRSEKKSAKKAYTARKAHAKTKYQQAVASHKVATERTTRDVARPFSVQVPFQLG